MNAVKKYCNKAVLIEDGLIKVVGAPDDVANQYSLDNASQKKALNDDFTAEHEAISDLKVELLTPAQITPNQEIKFEISYQVKQDIPTYIAFSLTDIDRSIWIYNDNSFDDMTNGKGEKRFVYTCSLAEVNDIKLKLQVSVRNHHDQILAFANSKNTPIILINRNDISDDDISAKDSATGLIQRNGSWIISQ